MKIPDKLKIVIFAGTTEGRRLSELLAAAKIAHTVCVATEYGEIAMRKHSLVRIHQGRMNREEICFFLQEGQFTHVIDTTHPYAEEVTRNIKAAITKLCSEENAVSYLRLKRDGMEHYTHGVTYFESNEACAEALQKTTGNILLTTGSKELFHYCKNEAVTSRLYVRILPGMESLTLCMKQGIPGKQIVAMQGPFTAELNEAMIRQYHISCMVTKESGASGGYPEKIEAAKKTGADVFVIGRPPDTEGISFAKMCRELERLCGKKLTKAEPFEIILAGIGMGNENGMTKEVEQAVRDADILFGAERMLAHFSFKPKKYPYYRAQEIIPFLQQMQKEQEKATLADERNIVVLFSGDSGFYSGCGALYAALETEIHEKRLCASLRILPGISSAAYLAACTGESYHDAAVYSIHGKTLCNLANRLKKNPKTFLLTSGVQDINRIGKALLDAGMSACEMIVGYQLSYPEQRILHVSPAECVEMTENGLYTCLVKNPYAVNRRLTHGTADEQFIREKVPMTKEEVREVSICKLHLRENAVVYDIGSGTGSVAAEIAGLSDEIEVYAVERNDAAIALIEKNREKFGLENIHVVKAVSPEGLTDLPTPTQAFIGGSGGRLKEILSVLWDKNRHMRIVITAVSMETICEIKEILSFYHMKDEEIVQLQINRAGKAGTHHLMRAENPIWICAFTFDGDED